MSVAAQLQLSDEEISITLRRAWDRALRTLASRVNKPTFETHIRAIRPMSLSEQADAGIGTFFEVTLGVPSSFTREWVEKRHSAVIAEALEEALDGSVRLRFVLAARSDEPADIARSLSPDPLKIAKLPEDRIGSAGVKPVDLVPDRAATKSPAAFAGAIESREKSGRTAPVSTGTATRMQAAHGPGGRSEAEAAPLNSRYTFDGFVTGQSNRLAHAGAHAVAQAPGQVYNPLFLYGPPGLGKTHLMHAIGNEIAQIRGGGSGSRVAYVSGESFTTNFITSLREGKGEEFRRRWRSVDVWLVDDIQFIAGKEGTKEEFFHTFNALYQSGKQIVISADRSPRDLRTMDERLRSRFESGLVADIAAPDLETRLAILQRKAAAERSRIPDDVLLYMARLIDNNIRTLEGALVKLIAYSSLVNAPVTADMATSVLERYYIATAAGPADGKDASIGHQRSGAPLTGGWSYGTSGAIAPEVIQRVVARRFELTSDALTGRKRDRDVAAARQIAMHLMRELTTMSLPAIGQFFGGRNHSTILYACDRVRTQLPLDDDLRRLVSDLTVQMRALQQASE